MKKTNNIKKIYEIYYIFPILNNLKIILSANYRSFVSKNQRATSPINDQSDNAEDEGISIVKS